MLLHHRLQVLVIRLSVCLLIILMYTHLTGQGELWWIAAGWANPRHYRPHISWHSFYNVPRWIVYPLMFWVHRQPRPSVLTDWGRAPTNLGITSLSTARLSTWKPYLLLQMELAAKLLTGIYLLCLSSQSLYWFKLEEVV